MVWKPRRSSGGPTYTGRFAVTVDGEASGPFSVYGVGAEATNFSVYACGPVAGCARGQCFAEYVVSVLHRNAGRAGMYEGDRTVAPGGPGDFTVVYNDGMTNDRSADGTATVTTWDFPALHFAGMASVPTEAGVELTIAWDVDGPE